MIFGILKTDQCSEDQDIRKSGYRGIRLPGAPLFGGGYHG